LDISDTLAPTSDQLDAVDLVGGPRTFTIENVSKGNSEQPVQVTLAEFPRVWRPGKSMRRVLAACWGAEASQWIGRRVTLYCDPNVTFGKDKVGGTRISHLSHIDKPRQIPLLVSKGRSAIFTVRPLTENAPPPEPTVSPATLAEIEAMFVEAQIAAEEQLPGVQHITRTQIASLDALTERQAHDVLAALRKKVGHD
jgi:hypothetical protein